MLLRILTYCILCVSVTAAGCLGFGGGLDQVETAQRAWSEGKPEGWRTLVATLEAGGPDAGKAALALGKTGQPEATVLLVREMLNRGPAEDEAVHGLGMLMDTRAVPALIRVVREKRPYAKEAVRILGDLKDQRAVPALRTVVDEKLAYRLDALESLGKIGDKSAVSTIMNWLREPDVEVPEEVLFRVTEQPGGEQDWSHTRTYKLAGYNALIPPRVEITGHRIQSDGTVVIDYTLFDEEFDELQLVAEFSTDGGKTWYAASTKGKLKDLRSEEYAGTLEWQTELDNLRFDSQMNLVFRLTPDDEGGRQPNGVPQMLALLVNYHPIKLQDVMIEATGDVAFGFYYPVSASHTLDNFVFEYSLNDGRNWLTATVREVEDEKKTVQDSVLVVWASAADLPGYDATNVLFRLSGSTPGRLGFRDVTRPFHVDNNVPPTIRITGVDERDLVELSYIIEDPERDPVTVELEFSKDGGISWERATLSGDTQNLREDAYHSMIRWYANFDIPEYRNFPIRIRTIASDRDPGPIFVTRDFYLKDSFFARRSRGVMDDDIEMSYKTEPQPDVRLQAEYSTNGGESWRNATITRQQQEQQNGAAKRALNWQVETDIPLHVNQIEHFFDALNNIQDPSVVPDLVELSLKRNSRNPMDRLRAVQALRLLEPRPPWVIDGLIPLLVETDPVLHQAAANLLRPVSDNPDVRMALQDYDRFWAHRKRIEHEALASTSEAKFYEGRVEELRTHRATDDELIRFFESRGYTRERAQRIVTQLDMFKFESNLRAQRDRKEITPEEYERRLSEEIRKRAGEK